VFLKELVFPQSYLTRITFTIGNQNLTELYI